MKGSLSGVVRRRVLVESGCLGQASYLGVVWVHKYTG